MKEQEQGENVTPSISAPRLSKAWNVESAHVPIYTGGKVSTFCLKQAAEQMDGDESEEADNTLIPCLVVPVSGDVAIIDAKRGLKLGSVRENGESGDDYNNDDDDSDDAMDADAITSYAISPSQSSLITCTHNHLIQQYSYDTVLDKNGSTRISFTLKKSWGRSGHSLPVTSMGFHKSGVFLATGSVDGTVRVWDCRGGHITHIFRPLAGGSGGSGKLSVTCVCWLEDTAHLVIAIGRDDGSIAIHNLRDKDMRHVVVLRDHMSAITCMAWWWKEPNRSPGSYPAMFLTAGRDGVLNLWRVKEASQDKQDRSSKQKKNQRSKQATKDSEWKSAAYEKKQTLPLYEQIEGMVLLESQSSEGSLHVATAGSKGIVKLWKATESEALDSCAEQPLVQAFGEARGGYLGLFALQNEATARVVGEDEPSIQQLIVADAEHSLSFLSLQDDHKHLSTTRTLVGYNDEILDLRVIPSPKEATRTGQVVVATNSAQVRVFDLDSFSCHVLDHHTATVLCVDVSPCGRYIATSGKDKRMCLWSSNSHTCVAVAIGHTEAVGAAALSKKVRKYEVGGKTAKNGAGSFAVTCSLDKTIKRWNLPGHNELEKHSLSDGDPLSLDSFASVRAHEKDINVVSIAPNDSLVATGSQDKTAKLFLATDLSLVATLKGHRRGVWDCQFSPVDRVLATASGDRSVRLWSLSDHSCVRTFQGHIASALRIRFLNGGLQVSLEVGVAVPFRPGILTKSCAAIAGQLASSGADGLIKIWTIRTNECEATLDSHSDKVWALDLAPSGNIMVSGSADSRLLIWKDTTEEAEDEKRAQQREAILMDQQLANHLRHKEFEQALDIALKLEKPRLALKVITSIIETDVKEKRNPTSSLKKGIPHWSIERVAQVLQYCREWNTRARNCDVAMVVVRAIVSVLPAEVIAGAENIPEILAGITPYAERHFDRLDRLATSSCLFDFALFSVGNFAVPPEEDFKNWESQSKLVLPPAFVDGRTQSGGQAIVGGRTAKIDQASDEDVSIVGDSDSSDDEGSATMDAVDSSSERSDGNVSSSDISGDA